MRRALCVKDGSVSALRTASRVASGLTCFFPATLCTGTIRPAPSDARSEGRGERLDVQDNVQIFGGPEVEASPLHRQIACFDHALVDIGLADDAALGQVLHDYFTWATTTTMTRYPQSADDVPGGLRIPHWSWDGLQV